MSVKAPDSRYHKALRWGLLGLGLIVSGVAFWQQSRSKAAHAEEVKTLNKNISALSGQVSSLNTEIGTQGIDLRLVAAKADQDRALREQAEKNMQMFVQATGNATRVGVEADLKKSPINVSVNGRTGTAVNQPKMDRVASFYTTGASLRGAVPAKDGQAAAADRWAKAVDDWWNGTHGFLTANCTAQAVVVANDVSAILPLSYQNMYQSDDVQGKYRVLDRLLGNLAELVKRPELCP